MALPKQNNYEAYKEMEINTANQGKLVVMLYDGAIRFLKIAADNMGSVRTYDVANNHLVKAQDILTELMISLNLDQGGEIAKNLFNIYAWMKKSLLEANIEKDQKAVRDAIRLLEELKTAWEEAYKKEVAKPAATVRSTGSSSLSISG